MKILILLLLSTFLYAQRPNSIREYQLTPDLKNSIVKYYADTTALKAETGANIYQGYVPGFGNFRYSTTGTPDGSTTFTRAAGGYWVLKEGSNSSTAVDVKLFLPDTIYASTGQECNVYFDNIVQLPDYSDYKFVITCVSGSTYENRWSYTASSTETVTWGVNVYDQSNTSIASGSSILRVSDGGVIANSKNMMVIGDSKTAAQTYVNEIKTLAGSNLTMVGTQGTTNLHEGHSGKTYEWFATDAASPFVYSGVLNISQYLLDNSINDPDFVVFDLGTNDVFTAYDSGDLVYLGSLIAAFKADVSNVVFGVGLEIPPAYSQDAFGNNYNNTSNWQFKQNIYSFNKAINDVYKIGGSGVLPYVTLVPFYLNIDTKNNFPTASTVLNARNSTTYDMQSNGVHPATSGYEQMADVVFSWLKGRNVGTSTYLVEEDFEGVGAPSGWSGSATVNYDYTPALRGSESARITDTGTTYLDTPSFANQDTVWIAGTFTISSISADVPLFYLRNSGGNSGYLQIRSSDMKLRVYHGTQGSAALSTTVISLDTKSYYWVEYKIGTGADGYMSLYVNSTNARPGSPEITMTNGNSTSQVNSIRYYDWTTISNYTIDGVRVNSTEISTY